MLRGGSPWVIFTIGPCVCYSRQIVCCVNREWGGGGSTCLYCCGLICVLQQTDSLWVFIIWNGTRPRAPVQNKKLKETREWIITQKMPHKHNNKDASLLLLLVDTCLYFCYGLIWVAAREFCGTSTTTCGIHLATFHGTTSAWRMTLWTGQLSIWGVFHLRLSHAVSPSASHFVCPSADDSWQVVCAARCHMALVFAIMHLYNFFLYIYIYIVSVHSFFIYFFNLVSVN